MRKHRPQKSTKNPPRRVLKFASVWQKMANKKLCQMRLWVFWILRLLFAGRCPCRCGSAISIIHIHRHYTITASRERRNGEWERVVDPVQTNKRQHLQYGQMSVLAHPTKKKIDNKRMCRVRKCHICWKRKRKFKHRRTTLMHKLFPKQNSKKNSTINLMGFKSLAN